MKRMLATLAAAALATGVAGATDKTDVMAVVHQYTDDFNEEARNLRSRYVPIRRLSLMISRRTSGAAAAHARSG